MKSLKAVKMPYRELLSLATTLLRQYPTFNRLCTAENTEEMSHIARKHSNAHEKATGICRVCFRWPTYPARWHGKNPFLKSCTTIFHRKRRPISVVNKIRENSNRKTRILFLVPWDFPHPANFLLRFARYQCWRSMNSINWVQAVDQLNSA